MHARVVRGVGKGVLFREVSSVQECPHRERGSTLYDDKYRNEHVLDELAQLHSALSETNEEVGQLVRNWSDRLRTGQTTANKFDQDYK